MMDYPLEEELIEILEDMEEEVYHLMEAFRGIVVNLQSMEV